MAKSCPDFETFLKTVRGRMRFGLVSDRLGYWFLATSLSAILLLPFSIWTSLPKTVVFVAIACIAIVAAGLLVAGGWPSLTDAATAADRQFGFDDLLTTALGLRPVPFDDLSTVVTAVADSRCRELHPTTVHVSRLSRGSWSGIALLAAVAGTLAIVPLRSTDSSPAGGGTGILAEEMETPGVIDVTRTDSQLGLPHSEPVGEDESRMISTIDRPSLALKNQPAGSNHNTSAVGGQPSVGSGASWNANRVDNQNPRLATRGGDPSNQKGTVSGQGRETSRRSGTGGELTGNSVGDPGNAPMIPAWRGSDSPTAPAAASSPAQSGTIPPGYRDLAKDYFQ